MIICKRRRRSRRKIVVDGRAGDIVGSKGVLTDQKRRRVANDCVQEVNSEGRTNVHFIKLHAPWPLLCRCIILIILLIIIILIILIEY